MDELSLDLAQDGSLVTGEKLKTRLALTYISRIQYARIALKVAHLSVPDRTHSDEFSSWIAAKCIHRFCASGECRLSSVAYLRYLANKGDSESMLKAGRFIEILASHRDGKGGWKGYPYFYTLLVLTETNSARATEEIVYAVSAKKAHGQKAIITESQAAIRGEVLRRASSIVQNSRESSQQAIPLYDMGTWRILTV